MSGINDIVGRLSAPGPGGVLLFVGAGFSKGAVNLGGNTIPLAREFADKLAMEIGEPSGIPLDVIADEYNRINCSNNALLDAIKSEFSVKKFEPYHAAILRYPWRRIYSTNYDNLIEKLFSVDGIGSESFTRKSLPIKFNDSIQQIVHLNGFVDEINRGTLVSDFALTISNYIDDSLFDSKWANLLRHDFQLASSIVFIGYSMYDLDVSRILTLDDAITRKTFLVTHESVSRADEIRLKKFGCILPLGTEKFADIPKGITTAGGPKSSLATLENFEETLIDPSLTVKIPEKRDFDDLLERGVINFDILHSIQSTGSTPYVVPRKILNDIEYTIVKPKAAVLIHCDMGNGRSLLTDMLSKKLIENQFRVYRHVPSNENYSYDIKYFNDLKDDFVIIFEDAIRHDQLIEQFKAYVENSRLLATVKSSAYELQGSEIRDVFGDQVTVFDVNRMDRDDFPHLDSILSKGAFWGTLHGSTREQKLKFLDRECHWQFSGILTGLVDSPYFREKLGRVLSAENKFAGRMKQIITVALCLNLVEIKPKFSILSELTGFDVSTFLRNCEKSEIFDFFAIRQGSIEASSSVMSEYILRNFISDEDLIDQLYDVLNRCNLKYNTARFYRDISKNIMRFAFIEKIFKKTGNKSDKISRFYDRVGEIGFKNDNPQYWLQYAIASNSLKDYKTADRQFKASFEIAKTKGRQYYTYQIDNHYAKFLLESRTNVDVWDDFFDVFRFSHVLLMQQVRKIETGHYPYRVMRLYEQFFERRVSIFNKAHSIECRVMLEEALGVIEKSKLKYSRARLIKDTRESVSAALDTLDEHMRKRGW